MLQKRVAAIHDISGIGKCSLTVALPILSAAGMECCVIPTAVLSTHTGGFHGYTFCDLTGQMLKTAEHWKQEGFTFDAIYSGYLGSLQQIDLLKASVSLLRTDSTRVIVDPVMGDNGCLYKQFSKEFPAKMLELCHMADVITPNMTEAALMLDIPFSQPPYTKAYVEDILRQLAEICSCSVVLTGVSLHEGQLGAAALDTTDGRIYFTETNRVDGMYHGTGDIFASVLVAALVNGRSLQAAVCAAARFTHRCIAYTRENCPTLWYGVNFEEFLPGLREFVAKAGG